MKIFSVNGLLFDIRHYIKDGLPIIELANEANQSYKHLLNVVGCIGVGLPKVCSDAKGLYFNWIYIAPATDECVKAVSQRLLNDNWEQRSI